MARPKRRGLAYFPLDTDYLSDRKIQRLLITHGTEGVMVYLTLLCEIYSRNGYYLAYDETVVFDVAFSLHLEEKRVEEIIQWCVKVKLFDTKILQEHGMITSSGIQERYFSINKRNIRQIDPALISVTKTGVSVTKTPVSVTETPTKGKGNEKGKKMEKEKEKKEGNTANNQLNNFFNQNHHEENGSQNDDAQRRAELLRMAADATASAGDA